MSEMNLHAELTGFAPGAREWVKSEKFGSWYREEGAWAATIDPGEGRRGPRWDVTVWRHAKGVNEPGNGLREESVECYGATRDDEALARAKTLADRMLAARAS